MDPGPLPGAPLAEAAWTADALESAVQRGWNETLGAPELVNGSWRARFTPGNLTGLAGDTARVRAELWSERADDAPVRLAAPEWARIVGAKEWVEIAPSGGAIELDVLVGPVGQLNLTVQLVEHAEECCAIAFFEGPRVGLASAGSAATTSVAHGEGGRAPAGLSVDAGQGRVDARWTYREIGADCDQTARSLGEPLVRDLDGARTLVLFVHASSSDACAVRIGETPPRPQVHATATGLAPGEVEVRVFLSEVGMILPSGWQELRERARVG